MEEDEEPENQNKQEEDAATVQRRKRHKTHKTNEAHKTHKTNETHEAHETRTESCYQLMCTLAFENEPQFPNETISIQASTPLDEIWIKIKNTFELHPNDVINSIFLCFSRFYSHF